MIDVSESLYEEMLKVIQGKTSENEFISSFLKKIKLGECTLEDAQMFSKVYGESLAQTFVEVLTEEKLPNGRLYWNIADKTVKPMIDNGFDVVMNATEEVQKVIDKSLGIGIKPIIPKRPDKKIKNVLNYICEEDITFSELLKRLDSPIVNLSEQFFDLYVEENAKFRNKAGIPTKVIRRVSGKNVCKWCMNLQGTYSYEEAKKKPDLFKRHDNCHCITTYINKK